MQALKNCGHEERTQIKSVFLFGLLALCLKRNRYGSGPGCPLCYYICTPACTLSQKRLYPAEHYCHLQGRGNLDHALIFSVFPL